MLFFSNRPMPLEDEETKRGPVLFAFYVACGLFAMTAVYAVCSLVYCIVVTR